MGVQRGQQAVADCACSELQAALEGASQADSEQIVMKAEGTLTALTPRHSFLEAGRPTHCECVFQAARRARV